MWNNYFRPRRDLPQVNYNESSDEEDPFLSPERPVNTRAGSPVELAVPTLNDNVDEELDQVRQTLQNVGHTPLFRQDSPETVELEEEEVVSGLVFQGAAGRKLNDTPPGSGQPEGNSPGPAERRAAAMPVNPPVVEYDEQNTADGE